MDFDWSDFEKDMLEYLETIDPYELAREMKEYGNDIIANSECEWDGVMSAEVSLRSHTMKEEEFSRYPLKPVEGVAA